jgi:hypothetical protein
MSRWHSLRSGKEKKRRKTLPHRRCDKKGGGGVAYR